jgi:hypothetical protein
MRLVATVALLSVAYVAAAQSHTTRLFVFATRGGEAVSDLAASEFDVKENGASCSVVSATRANTPMRVVVLIDNTDANVAMGDPMRRGLRALLDAIPTDIEVALVTVSESYSLRVAPTTDRKRLQGSIDALHSLEAGTVVAQSLMSAATRLFPNDVDRWPVFVIVSSDAAENTTMVKQPDFDAFSRRLNDEAASVHAVVITAASGNSQGSRVLDNMTRTLTANTGGAYEDTVNPRALPDLLTGIGARISSDWRRMAAGYEVHYTCAAPRGADPAIEIGTPRDGVILAPSFRRVP